MSPTSTSPATRARRIGRSSAVALGSGAVLVAGSGGLLAVTSSAAMANPVISVSNTNDNGPGSLRSAINDANTTPGADVISFDAGLTGTISLASDLPTINEAVDILGVSGVTIDGGWRDGTPGGSTVFYFAAVSGSVTISDVSIVGSYKGANSFYGSAIMFLNATADVVIDNVSITNSYALEGGPIGIKGHTGGSVTISNSTISGNKGHDEGGAITVGSDGTNVNLISDVIDGNANDSGEGGALYLSVDNGTTTISNSTLTNNESSIEGGALHLSRGDLIISNSTFSGNHVVDGSGGALYLDGGMVDISNSTFSGNSATTTGNYGNGGAITGYAETLHISGSSLTNNTAAASGGAISVNAEFLEIESSTIAGNTAALGGGGIHVEGNTVTRIANSTIATNRANGGEGGAIEGSTGGLTLIADTITQNQSVGISGVSVTTPEIAPGSVHSRSAKRGLTPAGSITAVVGPLTLDSTILAGNGSTDLGQGAGATAIVVTSTHSLIGTSLVPVTDLGGTQTGVSGSALLLGPLTNNGGPTSTFALLAGSPAIDAGPATLPAFPGSDFDQRGSGFARVVNGLVDIGAYEIQDPTVKPSFTG